MAESVTMNEIELRQPDLGGGRQRGGDKRLDSGSHAAVRAPNRPDSTTMPKDDQAEERRQQHVPPPEGKEHRQSCSDRRIAEGARQDSPGVGGLGDFVQASRSLRHGDLIGRDGIDKLADLGQLGQVETGAGQRREMHCLRMIVILLECEDHLRRRGAEDAAETEGRGQAGKKDLEPCRADDP